MSLVNDTLQDLEARRGEDSLSRYAAVNVKVGRSDQLPGVVKVRVVGILLLLVAGIIYWLQEFALIDHPPVVVTPQPGISQPSISQPSISQPSTPQPKQALLTTPAVAQNKVTDDLATEAQLLPSAAKEPVNDSVRRLLGAAAVALVADRLMVPAGDSARDYYQRVLAVDPQQQEALLGLQAIARRYYELAETQEQQGERVQALMFAGRGLTVAPDHALLLQLRSRLLEDSTANPIGSAEIETAETEFTQKEVTQKKAQAETASRNTIGVEDGFSGDISSEENTDKLVVQLSVQSLDRQRADAARESIEQEGLSAAVGELEALQKTEDLGRDTTAALADLYLQQQQPEKAIALLKAQAVLPEEQAAYLIGRAQIQAGKLAAAVVTLESLRPQINHFPNYYALLAAAYQQGGQNHLAAELYRKLTLLQPDSYTHWLGLAVSLDKLREQQAALTAFRQVLPMLPQQSHLEDYVRQRVTALAGQ